MSRDSDGGSAARRYPVSIVASTHGSAFTAVSFAGEVLSRIGEIADLGFDGVELAIRDPRLVDDDAVVDVLERCKLAVPAISTGQAYVEEGLLLTSSSARTRRAALQRVLDHLPFAARVQAIVIIGLMGYSSLDGQSERRAREQLIAALHTIAAEADAVGVRIALEPVNRYESPLLHTAQDGLAILDAVGDSNVGLLLDTFHMNIEESSMPEALEACGTRLFHVHLADSNRRYPGSGHVDFFSILGALDRIDYGGFVSGEFLPHPSPHESAKLYIHQMTALQRERG